MRQLQKILATVIATIVISGAVFLQIKKQGTADILHQESNFQTHFQQKPDLVSFDAQPAIAIVPHHLVASDLIYQTLARVGGYAQKNNAPVKRIVLLAPNHFERGPGNVLTTRASWQTRNGVVQVDEELVDRLIDAGLAQDDFQTLELEHGIFNIMPFIKLLFPDARVTPLSIRGELSASDRTRVVEFLHKQLGPQVLMIVSADFTHYVSESVMNLHDVGALNALIALNPAAANGIDVDTPASIEIAMRYALVRDAKNFVLTRRTSSAKYLKRNEPPDTTSYVSGVYIAGQQAENSRESTVVYIPKTAAQSPLIKMLTHGFENVSTAVSSVTTREAARALVRSGAQLVVAPDVVTGVSAEIFENVLIVYEPSVAVGIHMVGSGKQARATYYIYPLEQNAQRMWQLAPFPNNRELLKGFSASMDATQAQREAIEFERGLSI
jgi:AmmeMemoRadiSam system protein B